MRWSWLFAGALACCFRASYPMPPDTMVVRLAIDPHFSDAERADVIGGAESWTEAVGTTLRFEYSIRRGDESRAVIAVMRGSGPEDLEAPCGRSSLLGCYDHGAVFLAADRLEAYDASLLRTVSGHEIGHALGLGHAQPPSIMTEYTDHMSPRPTDSDVAAFCHMHGCRSRSL